MRIIRSELDLNGLAPLSRTVTERLVHTSGDLLLADELLLDEAALEAGRAALADGAAIVCDVRMVTAGITSRPARTWLGDERVPALAAEEGLTRSAAAIRLAAQDVGPGAVWAIGNAPTALRELLRLAPDPALVVGLPVGFVDAAESKAALAVSGLPALTNVGRKGGSGLAAAAVNALLYADAPA